MKSITVYIDGQCPLCVAGALRFRQFVKTNSVCFVDSHDLHWATRAAARFTAEEMAGSMRAQMPDGTWRTGWFAWAAILEALPPWLWLGRLMRLPIFYGIGPALYQWVAKHRQGISQTLRLPPPCDERGVCRLESKG
ncbi:MAG: DUF393 domain-containing protein [Armatimonadota bacterium]|nr:DUF393 domain-containing protein [Armatimonadota bacterium]